MSLAALTVRVGGDISGLSRSLNQGTRVADRWAKMIGPRIDSAFAGMAGSSKKVGLLSSALGKVTKATGLTRTALAVTDVGRAAGWTAVGYGKLRLAFMASGDKADALRARTDKLAGGLRAVGAASYKVRLGTLVADLGVLAVKMAAVGWRIFGGFIKGLASIGMAGFHAAGGLVRIGESVVGVGVNAIRATASMGRFAAAVVKRDWGKALVHGFAALQSGLRATTWLPTLAGGFMGIAKGAVSAVGGVMKMGGALAGLALKATTSVVSGLTSAFGGLARSTVSVVGGLTRIAAMGAVVGGALALSFGVKAAASAAHLNEAYNKVEQTFGNASSAVVAAANNMNTAFGTSRQAFLDGSTALGGMLQGMGYAAADSAKLGTNLTRLAADASAFRDVPLDQALQKIRSGLSGEAEPLKEWGILISDNAVKAEAFRMGLTRADAELSESAKVQARLSLITQGLAKDQGALAREATGPAAQMAEFHGRVETLVQTIGASLAPAFGALLEGANSGLIMLKNLWEANSAAVLGWFGITADTFAKAGTGTSILTEGIVKVAYAWETVKGYGLKAFAALESGVGKLYGWLSKLFEGLEWLGAGDWAKNAKETFKQYADAATQVSKDVNAKAAATLAGRDDTGDRIRKVMAEAQKQVEAARQQAAAPLDFTAGKPTDQAQPPKSQKKDPFGGAYERNSKEAASVILRSKYGGSGDPVAKATQQTAQNTAKQTGVLEQIRDNLKGLATQTALEVMGF